MAPEMAVAAQVVNGPIVNRGLVARRRGVHLGRDAAGISLRPARRR